MGDAMTTPPQTRDDFLDAINPVWPLTGRRLHKVGPLKALYDAMKRRGLNLQTESRCRPLWRDTLVHVTDRCGNTLIINDADFRAAARDPYTDKSNHAWMWEMLSDPDNPLDLRFTSEIEREKQYVARIQPSFEFV